MMIAPMGTSPDSAASRASARAACMSSSGLRIAYIVIARGLLLGHAVEGAEAPDEVNAVHADDVTAGKNLSENVESKPVVGVVKGGNKDQVVGEVEIRVAGRDTLVAEDNGARHGQLADGELLA